MEISWIKASFSLRRTDRESGFLQPLDRTNLTFKITDYFIKLRCFSIYLPVQSRRKRINGQYINAKFKFVEFHYTSGNLVRSVQFKEGLDRAAQC